MTTQTQWTCNAEIRHIPTVSINRKINSHSTNMRSDVLSQNQTTSTAYLFACPRSLRNNEVHFKKNARKKFSPKSYLMNKMYHNSKCFDVLRSRSAFCYVSVDRAHPISIPENARERPKRFQDRRQWPSSPKRPSRPSQYHNLVAFSWQLALFFLPGPHPLRTSAAPS
jgi:hypothetical protein